MRALFPYLNPLRLNLADSFFKSLPEQPGVYRMYSGEGELLYVGKAKNLKLRLQSYRAQDLPRKVLRLIRKVYRIEFEILATEKEALLRENQLLRLHRPPFNRQKTQPESYFLLSVTSLGSNLKVSLLREIPPPSFKTEVFGSFKGQGHCSRVLMALYRVLKLEDLQDAQIQRDNFRTSLQRERSAFPLLMEFSSANMAQHSKRLISRYLRGISKEIIRTGESRLEGESRPMIRWFLKNDVEILNSFFTTTARRLFRMRKFSSNGKIIAQTELDDLIVEDAFSTN